MSAAAGGDGRLYRWAMTTATRSTILTALEEAGAAARRGLRKAGADHAPADCEACTDLAGKATEYARTAGIVAETEPQAADGADREAGQ